MGAIFMIAYTLIAIGGGVALNPDWGILRKNTNFRFVHKWVGRFLIAVSWVICVQGFLKMLPNDLIKQGLFGAPLLLFGFYCLL